MIAVACSMWTVPVAVCTFPMGFASSTAGGCAESLWPQARLGSKLIAPRYTPTHRPAPRAPMASSIQDQKNSPDEYSVYSLFLHRSMRSATLNGVRTVAYGVLQGRQPPNPPIRLELQAHRSGAMQAAGRTRMSTAV